MVTRQAPANEAHCGMSVRVRRLHGRHDDVRARLASELRTERSILTREELDDASWLATLFTDRCS